MLSAFEQFSANVAQVRDLVSLAETVDLKTTGAVHVDDVYRSGYVLGVSAVDHYVHEKVLAEMLNIANGSRPPTSAFRRFRVPIDALQAASSQGPERWLVTVIRDAHSRLTFQRPDAIADAVKLVHPNPLWPAVASELHCSVEQVRDRLTLIVDRRNKIAHEADCEPGGLGFKWPISARTVRESLDFIVETVSAIESVI